MVTPLSGQTGGACGKVSIFNRYGPYSSPASGKIHYGTPSLLFGYAVLKQCFGGGASAGLVSRLRK